jgi:hypothetical protein
MAEWKGTFFRVSALESQVTSHISKPLAAGEGRDALPQIDLTIEFLEKTFPETDG